MRLIDADALIEKCGEWYVEEGPEEGFIGTLGQLLSVQPDTNCSEIPNNSDTISRQQAIDELNDEYHGTISDESMKIYQIIKWLNELPSVQPERKTGHWIKTARWGRVYYCDQCRNYLDFDGVNAGRGSTNFCPNCGAKMERRQDGH